MIKSALQFLKENILKLFLLLFGIAILLTVVFYVVYSKNPTDAIEEIRSFKMANESLFTESNTISFWRLLINNIKSGTIYLLLGFLAPLSILMMVVLAKSLGTALVYSVSQRAVSVWKIVLLGILPHGIFEWTAVFLCIALGLYIGTYWFRKTKKYNWKQLATYTVTLYFSIIIPLMFIAALVETFVTTQFSSLM